MGGIRPEKSNLHCFDSPWQKGIVQMERWGEQAVAAERRQNGSSVAPEKKMLAGSVSK
jgi:hypothetical protein